MYTSVWPGLFVSDSGRIRVLSKVISHFLVSLFCTPEYVLWSHAADWTQYVANITHITLSDCRQCISKQLFFRG